MSEFSRAIQPIKNVQVLDAKLEALEADNVQERQNEEEPDEVLILIIGILP